MIVKLAFNALSLWKTIFVNTLTEEEFKCQKENPEAFVTRETLSEKKLFMMQNRAKR